MSKPNKHKVLVYGTLRPFINSKIKTITGRLYDLGWYPGLILDQRGDPIICEEIEVTDKELDILDMYEGYDPDDPRRSLYVRVKLPSGEFVYQYNKEVNEENRVPTYSEHNSSDWQKYAGDPKTRLYTVLGSEFEPCH